MTVTDHKPVEPMTEQERLEQMRSANRDSMFLIGAISRPGGGQLPIKVRNLSTGGLMAECPSGFINGEAVLIHLARMAAIHGKIAWVAGPRIGVMFDAPIDPKSARRPVQDAPQRKYIKAAKSSWRPGLR